MPEEMPVNEAVMLEQRLASEVGVGVDHVFCNALYPERFSDSETGGSSGSPRTATIRSSAPRAGRR